MAMKALTAVIPPARRPIVPARRVHVHVSDWRELLIRQDAEVIWLRLSALVRLALPDRAAEHDNITQEVFLDLFASQRFNTYLEQNYSGEEIRQEIKARIASARK